MLHRHHRTIANLSSNPDLKYLIRDYFDLPRWQSLLPAMLARGLGQADLVLCLLRLRDRHRAARCACELHIAALVGRPIVLGPPCLRLWRAGPVPVHAEGRDARRRITYVVDANPRQTGTEAHLRWREYRIGRTVAQLLVRGVTKRDLRKAVRRGWVKVEEVA